MTVRGILKAVITVYCAIMLFWFAFPIILGILNLGNVTGIAVFACALVYCVRYADINRLVVRLYRSVIGRSAIIITGIAAVAIAVTTAVLTVLMTVAAYKAPDANSVLIVLGCRVYGDRASLMLNQRVNAAYDYLIENDGSVCILSGGQGDDEDISEAECMRRILTERGIDERRIYIEDKSTSTRENLQFSKRIIDENELGGRPVAIATNEFHQYRSQLIASELGMEAVAAVSGESALYLLPTYYVRELYGILHELIV